MRLEKIKAEASSKTLRKVVRKISRTFDVEIDHSHRPSEDLEEVIEILRERFDDVSDVPDHQALEYFRLGLVKGLKKAGDFLVDGTISKSRGYWIVDETVNIRVNIRLPSGKFYRKTLKIDCEEFGFKK
jgi:hypothetical protein